ncbi:hypothetical protein JKJ07_38215 [Actinoplanes sp. LDG1-01]|uniref:Carrier domain-containing protein n=2 Tax=Paractinoplanes lichenicola TaxID=2802976 RepID=A0ABS1W0A4_9ACTN|nr:hypothetical protein [Actinoplanes lichenicola]
MSAGGPTAGHLSRRGLRPMDPGAAIQAMAVAVGRGETTVVVTDVDWPVFAASFSIARARPLLDGIPEARAALAEPVPAPAGEHSADFVAGLTGLTSADQQRAVLELVSREVAGALGHTADDVAPDRPFQALGVDSLGALEIRNRLRVATGLELSNTIVFNHPTPAAVAVHLVHRLGLDEPAPDAVATAELDAVERVLRGDALDDTARERIVNRLRALLADSAGPSHPGDDAGPRLETATDDEVFDFIGREFGIS